MNQQNLLVPIYMRVTFKRAKVEARLNVTVHKNELSKWDPVFMRLKEKDSMVNHVLNSLTKKFNDFLILNSTSMSDYSAGTIRDYILGMNKRKGNVTVKEFVEGYFNSILLNNVNYSKGTVRNYRRAINHLQAYLLFRKEEQLPICKADIPFATEFKSFLVNSNPVLGRSGMTEVSAATVIKKFRSIFSQAVDYGLITMNPFKKVKIKTKSPKKERLSIEQVVKIRNLDLLLFQYLPLYRDIFLFSVYSGLSYGELMNLKWTNFEIRRDGNCKLTLRRAKTDIMTECFLPSAAQSILQKYESRRYEGVDYTVFPYRSNKELNTQVKVLAQLAGIPIRITMHTARHTFRQLLAEAGIFDMGVIKRMMGQSSGSDIDAVYYMVTDKGLLEAKKKFQSFLDSHFK